MSIDVSKFSPWAQKQIADKLTAQMREKAQMQATAQAENKRKYHNTPTNRDVGDGETIKFDSKREAARFDELMLMLKAGKIHELKLQPQFTLQESYVTPEGVRVRAIRYVADFSYNTGNGLIVEDVKGGKATQTRVYKLKKKLMQDRFGITVTEID